MAIYLNDLSPRAHYTPAPPPNNLHGVPVDSQDPCHQSSFSSFVPMHDTSETKHLYAVNDDDSLTPDQTNALFNQLWSELNLSNISSGRSEPIDRTSLLINFMWMIESSGFQVEEVILYGSSVDAVMNNQSERTGDLDFSFVISNLPSGTKRVNPNLAKYLKSSMVNIIERLTGVDIIEAVRLFALNSVVMPKDNKHLHIFGLGEDDSQVTLSSEEPSRAFRKQGKCIDLLPYLKHELAKHIAKLEGNPVSDSVVLPQFKFLSPRDEVLKDLHDKVMVQEGKPDWTTFLPAAKGLSKGDTYETPETGQSIYQALLKGIKGEKSGKIDRPLKNKISKCTSSQTVHLLLDIPDRVDCTTVKRGTKGQATRKKSFVNKPLEKLLVLLQERLKGCSRRLM